MSSGATDFMACAKIFFIFFSDGIKQVIFVVSIPKLIDLLQLIVLASLFAFFFHEDAQICRFIN